MSELASSGIIEELTEQLSNLRAKYPELDEEPSIPFELFSVSPVTIGGIACPEGVWKGTFYSSEELQKLVENSKNMTFPLKVDHGKSEVYNGKIVGEVVKLAYEPMIKAVIYLAKVLDPEAIKDLQNG